MIARLPNIKRLNGSEILDDERMFAERAFVRYHLTHETIRRPDRFHELHAINGRVDPLAEVDLSPPQTAHVTIIFNQQEEREDDVFNLLSSGFCHDASMLRSGQPNVKDMTVNLNKSVKDFKQALRYVRSLTVYPLPFRRVSDVVYGADAHYANDHLIS